MSSASLRSGRAVGVLVTSVVLLAGCDSIDRLGETFGVARQALVPTVRMVQPTTSTSSATTLSGYANPRGLASFGFFRYRTISTTSCADNDTWGARLPTSSASDVSLGSGSAEVGFTSTGTALVVGRRYYVCAFARNSDGVASSGTPVTYIPVNPNDLFNWAEQPSTYGAAFPAPGSPTSFSDPYTYRYYASTGNHLAVAGSNVFTWGPVSGNTVDPVLYDAIANLACNVYPAACATQPSITLSTTTVAHNANIVATLSNAFTTTGNSFRVAPVGSSDATSLVSMSPPAISSLAWTVAVDPLWGFGQFEFRYYRSGSTLIVARSAPFTVPVPLPPTLTLSRTTVVAGAQIAVTLSNGNSTTLNQLAVAPVGSPDSTRLAILNTASATGGWSPIIDPAWGLGQYEFRYYLNGSMVVSARSAAFTVTAQPVLTISKTTVDPGQTVTVTLANGSTTTGNRIRLAKVGSSDSTFVTDTAASGVTFSWTPTMNAAWGSGQFEFRYTTQSTTIITARSAPFTLTALPSSLSVAASAVRAGESNTVHLAYGSTGTTGNRIGLALVGSADSTYVSSVAANGATATWSPVIATPGTYEFRYYVSGGSVVNARSDAFTVFTALTLNAPVTSHVGVTPTAFDVGSGGAANFQVRVEVPPGVGEVSPELAFEYSSNGGDGVLGIGWSLSGVSSIARCEKTVASNGFVAAVSMTASDRFCLDGVQLKLVSGTYGASGSVYATEQETFSKIVASGAQGGGPVSFTVTSKNGLVYTYAGASGVAASGAIRSWLLTQVADRVGNNMRFVYDFTTEATPRLTEVNYPYTASGQGPFYRVRLTYEARPTTDFLTGYNSGLLVEIKSRIQSLVVESLPAASLIRRYDLTYDQGPASGRSRLRSLRECVPSGCRAATTIDYAAGTGDYTQRVVVNNDATGPDPLGLQGSELLQSADLDGNGRADLIYARVPAQPFTGNMLLEPRIALSASGTAPGFQPERSLGFRISEHSMPLYGRFARASGTQLLLAVPDQVTGQTPIAHILTFNGSGFSDTDTGIPAPLPPNLATDPNFGSRRLLLVAADVSGDGLTDLVFLESTAGQPVLQDKIWARLNITVDGGPIAFAAPVLLYTFPLNQAVNPHASSFRVIEVDRDGASDLFVTSYPNFHVLKSNPSATGQQPSTAVALIPNDLATAVDVADWNGDGCDDLITGLDESVLRFSNCRDGYVMGPTLPVEAAPSMADARQFVDYDGDGRRDLFFQRRSPFELVLLRSTGHGYERISLNNTIPAPAMTCHRQHVFLDSNGDGLTDIASLTCNPPGSTYDVISLSVFERSNQSGALPDTAVVFRDGAGVAHQVAYGSMARETAPGTGAVFPLIDFRAPLQVVTQVTSNDGNGGSYQRHFAYAGARTHVQGRGLAGFASRAVTDSRLGLTESESYQQTYPFVGKMVERVTTVPDGASAVTTSRETHAFASQTVGTGFESRFFVYDGTSATSRYELDASKKGALISTQTIQTTYGDGYGNPTRVVTTTTDADTSAPSSPFAGLSWVVDKTMTYQNTTSPAWCLGLPATSTETRTTPGQLQQVRSRSFVRDTTLCRLTGTTDEPGDSLLETKTTFLFDSCGNERSISVVGRSATGSLLTARTTTRSYGTRCQFVESETAPLSQTTTTTYDLRFGIPQSRTDINGLVTTWLLDEYGRVVREVRPDGTFTTTRHDSTTCPTLGSALKLGSFTDSYSAQGARVASSGTCLDELQRVRLKGSVHPLSAGFFFDEAITYDALGRIVRRDRPRDPSTTASNGFESFEYDALNRVTVRSLWDANGASAGTTRTRYQGLTTTVTDPRGASTTFVADVAGNNRIITEPFPGGVTRSAYDGEGRQVEVIDALGKVTRSEYTRLGFRKTLVDPDKGTTTFSVNSLGEVTTQRNARAQSTTFVYDTLGRLTSRTEPEGASTWTWGTTTGTRGRTTAVAGPGYAESLQYDGRGRLIARTITTDQAYVFNYTYNDQGLVETLRYPISPTPNGARVGVRSTFSEGTVVRLDDVTTSTPRQLWRAEAFNATNEVISQSLGTQNALSLTRAFEPHSRRLSFMRAGVAGSQTNRANLSYSWDFNGNLERRHDLLTGAVEDFVNDPLNRLSQSRLNGSLRLAVTYDASGNIASRSDVGTYAYADAAHPHGVTSAGSNTFTYDATGNVSVRNGQAQTWTSYNFPTLLRANGQTTTFSYSPTRQLFQQVATYPLPETTTALPEGLERVVSAAAGDQWRHSISTGAGTQVLLVRSLTGAAQYGVVKDQLGSPIAIIDDATGQTTLAESFEPFGRRAAATGWQGSPSASDWAAFNTLTHAGFAGHSQLDNLGLVNMKGRVYDPGVGRFLSVDPIQSDSPQGLNPYSYVHNRPLSLTDSSGFDVDAREESALERHSANLTESSRSNNEVQARTTTPTTPLADRIVVTGQRPRDTGVSSMWLEDVKFRAAEGQRFGNQYQEVRAGHGTGNGLSPGMNTFLGLMNDLTKMASLWPGNKPGAVTRLGNVRNTRATWGNWMKARVKPELDGSPRANPGELPEYIYRGLPDPAKGDDYFGPFRGHEKIHRTAVWDAAKEGIALTSPKYEQELGAPFRTTGHSSYWSTDYDTARAYAGEHGIVLRLNTRGLESAFSVTPYWEINGIVGSAKGEVRGFASFFGVESHSVKTGKPANW